MTSGVAKNPDDPLDGALKRLDDAMLLNALHQLQAATKRLNDLELRMLTIVGKLPHGCAQYLMTMRRARIV